MELWIKTQNKGLHQIIGINEPYIQRDCVALIGYNNYKHIELGVYKTEKRALEVLDEIKSLFIKQAPLENILTKDGLTLVSAQITSIVYEIPEN